MYEKQDMLKACAYFHGWFDACEAIDEDTGEFLHDKVDFIENGIDGMISADELLTRALHYYTDEVGDTQVYISLDWEDMAKLVGKRKLEFYKEDLTAKDA